MHRLFHQHVLTVSAGSSLNDGGGCLGAGGGEKASLAWCQTMVCIPGIAGGAVWGQ